MHQSSVIAQQKISTINRKFSIMPSITMFQDNLVNQKFLLHIDYKVAKDVQKLVS